VLDCFSTGNSPVNELAAPAGKETEYRRCQLLPLLPLKVKATALAQYNLATP